MTESASIELAKTAEEELVTAPQHEGQCAHHWIIEPPIEMTSMGVCKKCGAQKVFDNHLP